MKTMEESKIQAKMQNPATDKSKSEDNNLLDNILSEFKLYEVYHIKFMILTGLVALSTSIYCTNYIFVAEDVNYRCIHSICEDKGHLSAKLNSVLDFKCKTYSFYDNRSLCSDDNIDLYNVKDCDEWVYENKDSFVAEFNLGCENWKRTLIGTMHSIGYMLGLPLTGTLSDKFGRKTLVICNAIAAGIIGLSKSFVMSYWLYAFLEMVEPIFGEAYSATYMLTVESVSKNNRPVIIVILSLFSTLGSLTKPVIAWLTPNWRVFLMSVYGPSLIFIVYIFWLPESPRWLLNKGKTEKAARILRNAAETNNIVLDNNSLLNLKCEENSSSADLKSLLKITFQSKKLLLRLLGCFCMWFTALFNSYTLSINSVSLQGNKYLNYGLVSAAEIPAVVILFFAVTKCKRKLPIILSLTCTAVFCGGQPFVPKEYHWISLLLYACGKMTSSVAIRVVYLYTSELFPTYTRYTMHALCSSVGRMAIIIAPQTPLLLKYWTGFPPLLVGILSLITAAVVTLMPETSDDVLPDNVWEAEAVGSRQKKKQKEIKIYSISSRL